MSERVDSSSIIDHLRSQRLVSSVKIVVLDEALSRFVLRVRCTLLPSSYRLEVRIIQTQTEMVYSYQLYTDKPLIRWDNSPHFPSISTHPHHRHDLDGTTEPSPLSGNIFNDLDHVFNAIRDVVTA
jgi:hypothetical protein